LKYISKGGIDNPALGEYTITMYNGFFKPLTKEEEKNVEESIGFFLNSLKLMLYIVVIYATWSMIDILFIS